MAATTASDPVEEEPSDTTLPAHLKGRIRLRRVLPLLLTFMMVACAADTGLEVSPTLSDSPSTTENSTTSTSVAQTSTTSVQPSTTTSLAVDPAEAFGNARAASAANYKFVSRVTSGGEDVTTIEGVVDHGSISATISAGTGQVSYVRTPEGEWIREADGDWVEAGGEPPVTPPLDSLADPAELEVVSADAHTITISGRLGASAGEAAGIPFAATIVAGLMSDVSYEATSAGESVVVTTTLSEIGEAGLVTAPTDT